MLNAERGSLRSRGAATVSSLTLRQLSAVLPPKRAWGLWLSRQILARIMDTFGPSLKGTHVERIDAETSDGRCVIGEWVYDAVRTPGGPCELRIIAESLSVNTSDQEAG